MRRESGGSNPCRRQGKLGEMLPGHRSDRMVKTLRDKSMVEKREAGEHARPVVLQGPRDRVKAGLLEPQTPEMERHIHRHGMYGRCRRDRTVTVSPFELSSRRATANEAVQGVERGTYVTSNVRFDRTRDRLLAARPRATEWP